MAKGVTARFQPRGRTQRCSVPLEAFEDAVDLLLSQFGAVGFGIVADLGAH